MLCMTVGLLGLSSMTRADDIDVYSDNAGSTGVPNVLFVLDNAANFSASAANCTYDDDGTAPTLNGTAGGIEQCALYNVIKSLPEGAVNIGLMVYNDNNMRDFQGLNCGGSNGGCLAQPLTRMEGSAKTDFLAWIRSWVTSGLGYNIKASGKLTASTMQESWAYYAGNTGMSGRSYSGIQPVAGCQKNFVIFIGNAFNTSGGPGDGGSGRPDGVLAVAPGVTAEQTAIITIPSGSYGSNTFSCQNNNPYVMGNNHADLYADEWARYMHQTDIYGALVDNQGITTYTVGLLGPSCQADYPALLSSMADVGGGKYFATSSYDEISTAIFKILNEIQAVNSVFSSATLPVSVNAQGTYLNQIFLGMFRPDANANPRWVGNLKQYQFILEYPDPSKPDPNTATLKLGDSAGQSAISSAGTGFITPTAISFWTKKDITNAPDLTGGFFVKDPQGAGKAFDLPDGELVEKGGAAQQLRLNNLTVDYASTPSSPRRLYTYCPSGSSCTASLNDGVNAFATSNAAITDGMLSAVNAVGVSSITRSGTTATVITAVNHGFLSGDTVIINGATQSEYNGTKTLIVKLSDTSFSYTVPEYPPSPAAGTYSVSLPSALAKDVESITRSGNTATVTVSAHGYTTGNVVTISGAAQAEYNGSFSITNTGVNTFTYTANEGPPLQAGGGTVTKTGGATVAIEYYNALANRTGILRALGSQTVQVRTSAKHNLSTGATVTLSGVVDSSNVAVIRYNIGPVPITNTGQFTFTFQIPGESITPASLATQAVSDTTIKAQAGGDIAISTLTRSGTVATATTSVSHGFSSSPFPTVNIGGTLGTNESAYVGSFPITSIPTANSFTYSVVTTPVSSATGTITARKSGTSDRTALINWVRGEDNFGDEASPGSPYNVRPSIHGDVLHSRPVAINFGTDAAPKVVVFYGANDGVFRAVNGNQTGSITSGGVTTQPGTELWGLVLPEHFGKLNRQRVNNPELKLPSTVLASAHPKDYFVDGSPGVYQLLKADGTVDKAYLYLTMRRGGQFIYALDVSEPGDPKVKWKISNKDSGFGELGQTWSRPRVTLVNGYANPVLVFGAGYDPAEDAEPPTANTMGRGVFVVDAVTGVRVWSATYTSAGTTTCSGVDGTTTIPAQGACAVSGMNWAIPADISFVDRNNDGKTDRLYAADVGGNVWRVDLEPTAGMTPKNWQVSKLAALGCATGSCSIGTTPRKFFFPPNVVSVGATGGSSSYDVVLLGSGDREHPLQTSESFDVGNRFYALKDTATGMSASGTTIVETDLFNGGNVTSPSITYDGSGSGFYKTYATGEKSVNASVTSRGTTFFGTNRPTPPSVNSCRANLGEAKGYALNPFTGGFDVTVFDGGGLPPTPTVGIVTIIVGGKPVQKAFCVGCGGGAGDSTSALGAGDLSTAVPKNPRRSYWYKK
jgi:type IV pilus assembly protein PilY1